MILQLNPPLPVMTPKGEALAHILIDYGAEHDLLWVTFQDTGECWTWRNPEIRAMKNITMGRSHGADGIRNSRVCDQPDNNAGIQRGEDGFQAASERYAPVTPVVWACHQIT